MAGQPLIRQTTVVPERGSRPVVALGAVVTGLSCVFLLMPGSLGVKAHLVLHGVCAQRPSHSLHLADLALPLDARMTGLYTGAAVAALWLAVVGRSATWARMSRFTIVVLATFGMSLIVDGGNALLVDLNLLHPYPPSNVLRLTTGILAGTSVGAAIAFLFSMSTWEARDRERRSELGLGEVGPPLAISGTIGLLALSGFPVVYAPLTLWLLLATIGVFSAIAILLFVLFGDRTGTYRAWRDLAPLATGALVVAVSVIVALARFRLVIERTFALPQLT